MKYVDFIKKQNRYANLIKSQPAKAEELFKQSESNAADRRNELTKH